MGTAGRTTCGAISDGEAVTRAAVQAKQRGVWNFAMERLANSMEAGKGARW